MFDGAISIKRLTRDLGLHCARVAEVTVLMQQVTADEIEQLTLEEINQFSDKAKRYIRPLLFSEGGIIVPGYQIIFDELGAADGQLHQNQPVSTNRQSNSGGWTRNNLDRYLNFTYAQQADVRLP